MKKIICAAVFSLLCVVGAFSQQVVVAVAPFTALDGTSASDARAIAEIFGIELQATRTVRVVTRSNFEAVMNEHKFALSELSSDKKTAELAKGINANWVVRGQVQKLDTLIVVTATILDVNTLEVMGGAPMYLNKIEETATKMDGFIGTIKQRIGGAGSAAHPQSSGNYKIGDRGPAGGWIFYDKGRVINGWRYLEAAPAEAEFTAQWGAYGKDVSGTATGIGSGKQNTDIIAAFLQRNGEQNKAAQLCASLDIDGYKDWFLPSKDELNLLYQNLKSKGLGEFKNDFYWSSSQISDNGAWIQGFSSGQVNNLYKFYTYCVRAVRAF